MKSGTKRVGIWIAAGIIILILVVLCKGRSKKDGFSFSVEKVTHGPINNSITSTGTLQALKTVDVGTQVSGVIDKIYVDFNSYVKKGQLLAELDKTPLLAAMEDAQASLDQAKAQVEFQKANYDRTKALFDKQLAAQTDFDQATYNYASAAAGLKIAQAKYDKAKVNLNYATIYSPIDGVVLNRAVDEGQTVAASFNTPTLFSIANDLTQMQVEAAVDEADIGQVKEGQRVEFTVDAFPDKSFTGEVTQVRLQPTVVSNVTTYTVIVKASNPEKILMPGMTANITIIAQENQNAMLIPAKALRFKPDSIALKEYFTPPHQGENPRPKSGQWNEGQHHFPNMHGDSAFRNGEKVWIKKDNRIFPKRVTIGMNDGMNAEVLSGLTDDDNVIVGIDYSKNKEAVNDGSARSPFMPHPPSGRRR
jgi:HlyD family secretion protein